MNKGLQNQIRFSMQAKETDELIEIWKENDHAQWTDEAFIVVGEILLARIKVLPPQSEAKNVPPQHIARNDTFQLVLNCLLLVLLFPLGYLFLNPQYFYSLLPPSIHSALEMILPPFMLCLGLWALWRTISKNDTKIYWASLVITLFGGGWGTLINTFKITVNPEINNVAGFAMLVLLVIAIVADLIKWLVSRKSASRLSLR